MKKSSHNLMRKAQAFRHGSIRKGKIYEVVCGKLIDDNKDQRPMFLDRTIKSVDDINNYETIPYSWLGAFSLVEGSSKGEDKMSDIIEIKLNINGNKFGSYDDAILCIQQMKQQEEENMKRIQNEREEKLKKEKDIRIKEIESMVKDLDKLINEYTKDYEEEVVFCFRQ